MLSPLAARIMDLMHSGAPFTDMHLREGLGIRVLTPRAWALADERPAARAELEGLLDGIEPCWRELLRGGRAIARALDLPTLRLRMNVFTTDGGRHLNLALRALPPQPMSLKDTGLPLYVKEMLERGKGLILVTGATRSGKTTTLAALLRQINETRADHIVTIEDPIEYVLRPERAMISQKEVGKDTESFLMGLKDALRQSPDVIMIGEVRDQETAQVMLQAAESGHLVLATLHATSAAGAISKLTAFFRPEEAEQRRYTLANTLIGVIYQVLLPKAAFDGFVLAAEILANNAQLAKAIGDPSRASLIGEQLRRGEDKMSRSLNDALLDLVGARKLTASDAQRAAYDVLDLRQRLDHAGGPLR